MKGRIPRPTLALLIVFMAAAACGDDDGAGSSGTGATTAAPSGQATTTTATENSPATTTVATTTPPATAPSAGQPASDRLAEFFEAADVLDQRIKQAAALFNATFNTSTGAVGATAVAEIDALDATPLGSLVPAGMTADLEAATLAVFADLDSRISALQGGVRSGGDLICLGFGGESARRFGLDMSRARELASRAPPPVAAPDSPEAGMVAARLVYIHGSNWCCDSCGGYAYEEPIEVDWEGQIFGPGWIDAPFVATFDGANWKVDFPQAG